MRAIAILLACAGVVCADEGMWPFNQIPAEAIAAKYKFDATPEFLNHLREASVKIAGGAGAFVSERGLMVTNQHLVTACIGRQLSEGFYAAALESERKCDGIDAAVVAGIDEVTAQIGAEKNLEKRNAAIARMERECAAKNGGRCSVVRFFSGGRYDLYRYKVYSDVRLVFAPENDLAFFGRQRDSLTYLRYGLDVAFLRAYENGKPAATPNFLKWSNAPVEEGELLFASGDPVSTSRSVTSAELLFLRDRALPMMLPRLAKRIQDLAAYTAEGEQHRLAAEPALTELANEYKAGAGKLIGLKDDRMVARKTNFESKIKRAAERDSKFGTKGVEIWDNVALAYRQWQPNERMYQVVESQAAPGSALFRIARQLIRGEEPDASPVDEGVETLMLADYLEELKNLGDRVDVPMRGGFGARGGEFGGRGEGGPRPDFGAGGGRGMLEQPDLKIKALFNGKSTKEIASEAVKATALKDPAERRKLAANREAARKSEDPMIRIAMAVENAAQSLRKRREETIGALEVSAGEKIAQIRYRLFGAAEYPDATGTPRVAFGVAKGYTDRAGVAMPFIDTFSGLFYRANNDGPYLVPRRWLDARAGLDEVTPLDFVTTCDIGGGDAGAAVVNRAGELVGVTFDGNLESLPDTFLYTDEQARAVHVAAQGIVESLRKVYKAEGLLKELKVAGKPVS